MADATYLPLLKFIQWYRPGSPAPALAQSVSDTATTFYFNTPLYDEDDNIVTGDVILGVQRADGYVEHYFVDTGDMAVDGLSATVVRGIKLSGLDYTVGDANLAVAHKAGERVFVVVSGILVRMLYGALRGEIAAGGANFYLGDGTDQIYTFGYRDSNGLRGLLRWDQPNNKAQYSNDGTTWVDIDTPAPANVTTRTAANAAANNGELYMSTDDSNSLYFKDNGGATIKLLDDATQIIPLSSVQKYYGVSAAGTDAYSVTYSPVPAALVDGQRYYFKADVANTGACTFNANTTAAEGALAIKKLNDQDTETGDIEAGMIIELIYSSVAGNFKMNTPVASQMSTANSTTLTAGAASDADALHTHDSLVTNITHGVDSYDLTTASGDQVIAHGLGTTPKFIELVVFGPGVSSTSNDKCSDSVGSYNGSTNRCLYKVHRNASTTVSTGTSTTYCARATTYDDSSADQTATAAFDATNITLTWTKVGAPTGTARILWRAYA